MLTRYPDWRERLGRFLASNQSRPFQYGSWDCCLFPCDSIREITGTDIAAEFRGQYASRKDAYAAIRSRAGRASVRAVAEYVTTAHQMPSCPISYAQTGDLVLIQRPDDYSLGILGLNGREIIVTRARGLCKIPLTHGVTAWHA